MLKRTAIAIFAPLVLAACDPEVQAVEQDLVVAETTTTQTTPYYQQQTVLGQQGQLGVAGQQYAAITGQSPYGLNNPYGAQINVVPVTNELSNPTSSRVWSVLVGSCLSVVACVRTLA